MYTRIIAACVYDNECSELSAHVERLHALKDVPILMLHRSMQSNNVSISVLFTLARKCFSTLAHCLFCRKVKIPMNTYAHHLKTVHGPILHYYCEICNTVLPFLQQQTCNDHSVNYILGEHCEYAVSLRAMKR